MSDQEVPSQIDLSGTGAVATSGGVAAGAGGFAVGGDFKGNLFIGYPERETLHSVPNQHGVYISYDDQDTVALETKEKLSTLLKEPGRKLAVFAAPQCLASIEGRHKEYYVAMGLSHAAVILLSVNSLQSDAMYKVVRLLSMRQVSHTEQFNFIIVLVILDSTPNMLSTVDSKFASLNWEIFSPIFSRDPSTICTAVLAKLKSLDKLPYETNLALLGRMIGKVFRDKKVNANDLNLFSSFFKDELESNLELCTQIGLGMWENDVLAINTMVDHLIRLLDKETQYLFNLLSPSWIDPWVAHWIPEAAESPPGNRALVINYLGDFIDQSYQSYVELTIRSLIRRAYCSMPGNPGLILDLRNYSADGCGSTSLITNVREEIFNTVFKPPLPPTFKIPSQWESYLIREIKRFGPIFIIMYLPKIEIVPELMTTFKYVTFLFLTGQDFPNDVAALPNLTFLQPSFVEEDILKSWDYYQFAVGMHWKFNSQGRHDNG